MGPWLESWSPEGPGPSYGLEAWAHVLMEWALGPMCLWALYLALGLGPFIWGCLGPLYGHVWGPSTWLIWVQAGVTACSSDHCAG